MSKIVSGSHIGNGQYSVEIEVDKTVSAALKAKEQAKIDKLEPAIESAKTDLLAKQAATFTAYSNLNYAIDTGIEADIKTANDALVKAKVAEGNATKKVENLTLEKVTATQKLDHLNSINEENINSTAWCHVLADGSPEGVAVLTPDNTQGIELNNGNGASGNNSIIGIAGHQSNDGTLKVSQNPTAWGAFYNMAILPAMQKWRPRFKTATISNIDNDLNTCSISFTASSFLGLSLNKVSAANQVPINYMSCDSYAFSDGETVLVEVSGIDHNQYTVIGYPNNPKPCINDKVNFTDLGSYNGNDVDATRVFKEIKLASCARTCPDTGTPKTVRGLFYALNQSTTIDIDTSFTTNDPDVTFRIFGKGYKTSFIHIKPVNTNEGDGCANSLVENYYYHRIETLKAELFIQVGNGSVLPYYSTNWKEETEGGFGTVTVTVSSEVKKMTDLYWACMGSDRYSYDYETETIATFSGNAGTTVNYDTDLVKVNITKDDDFDPVITPVSNSTVNDTRSLGDNLYLDLEGGAILLGCNLDSGCSSSADPSTGICAGSGEETETILFTNSSVGSFFNMEVPHGSNIVELSTSITRGTCPNV